MNQTTLFNALMTEVHIAVTGICKNTVIGKVMSVAREGGTNLYIVEVNTQKGRASLCVRVN